MITSWKEDSDTEEANITFPYNLAVGSESDLASQLRLDVPTILTTGATLVAATAYGGGKEAYDLVGNDPAPLEDYSLLEIGERIPLGRGIINSSVYLNFDRVDGSTFQMPVFPNADNDNEVFPMMSPSLQSQIDGGLFYIDNSFYLALD